MPLAVDKIPSLKEAIKYVEENLTIENPVRFIVEQLWEHGTCDGVQCATDNELQKADLNDKMTDMLITLLSTNAVVNNAVLMSALPVSLSDVYQAAFERGIRIGMENGSLER